MPFIASMEGVFGYGRSENDPPSTTFPYITNIITTNAITLSDSQQGLWIFAQVSDTAVNVNLYDTRGVLRMSITPTSGTTNYCLAYFSALRPYRNIWISKLVTNLTNPSMKLDSNNNLVLVFSSASSTLYYDKNNNLIGSYGDNATNSLYTLKLSTTGIYNGASDPNTWIAQTIVSPANNMSLTYFKNMAIDSEGNVVSVFKFSKSASAPSTNIQTNAKDGTNIRTVSLASGAISDMLFVVKYAYDGSATNSWVGYLTSTNTFGYFSVIWKDVLQVNSLNQIILTLGTYLITGIEARDGPVNNNGAAGAFPAGENTYVIRFSSDGTASTSWRTIIIGLSPAKRTTPYAINIDSDDNIIVTGFTDSTDGVTSFTLYAYNLTDSPVAGVNYAVTSAYVTMFIVKYNNSGTPLWISSLETSGTSNTIYINGGNNQAVYNTNMRIALDASNNIIISGLYGFSTLSLYKATDSFVGTIANPSTSSNALFIIKISNDGSTGYIARIGETSVTMTCNHGISSLLIDSTGNIYIGGSYIYSINGRCGFFVNGNDTTAVVFATINNSYPNSRNIFVCRYDSNLSSVSIGYIREANGSTDDLLATISQMVLDSSNNIILAATYIIGNNVNLQIYYDGVNFITRTSITTVSGVIGIILAKFTFSSTGYWITRAYTSQSQNTSLVQAPLLNLLPNNTVRLFAFGNGSSATRFIVSNSGNIFTNYTIVPVNMPFALPYYIDSSGSITYV